MLPRFLETYPDLRFTLSMDDKVIDMVEGGFDLSIRIRAAMPDSALVARRIGVMRQRIFASPDYLARHGTPLQAADLKNHAIIGFLLADHLTTWKLSAADGVTTLELDPRVRVGNSLVLRDLLITGQGIGTLPEFVSDVPEASGPWCGFFLTTNCPRQKYSPLLHLAWEWTPRLLPFLIICAWLSGRDIVQYR